MMEHKKRLPSDCAKSPGRRRFASSSNIGAKIARSKKPTVTVTAIAREMLGFLWAIGRAEPVAHA